MSKREKLRQKLKNNPANATMQEVSTLLERFGFILERIRGSHHVYRFDDGERVKTLVVPVHGRKVKAVYVKETVTIIDELFPETEDEEDDEQDD